MASRKLMTNKQPIEWEDHFLTYRSALYGEVDGVQVACTHMTNRPIGVDYEGEHGSWLG